MHYCTLLYNTRPVVLRPLFIFCFDKRAGYNLVWDRLLKRPLLYSFEKRARILWLVWSRVLCACRFVFRSGSLDIIGGDASLITRDDTSNRYSCGLIQHFCLHPIIRNKNGILSPEYILVIIGSIVLVGFRMSRGLSANPMYLLESYHVYKIGWLLVRGISLPACRATVCDCHWEHPPGDVWAI